jgi:hypothetical protein
MVGVDPTGTRIRFALGYRKPLLMDVSTFTPSRAAEIVAALTEWEQGAKHGEA